MEQNDVVVKIDNLSKQIRKKDVLFPLSYELKRGNILALCGGNGAGKSTLIRMITGLIKPTTGVVTINDLQLKKNKQRFFSSFGYMPDDFQFQESISAKETINFYAKLKKIGTKQTDAIIKDVGLTEHLDKKVGAFSKGMRQRLLLAQALLAKPDVLILDEPTNGLDPFWVKQFSHIMMQARENGQTVIFSTHDLHVAEQIADEVIFLSDGKIISHGPIEQYKDIGLYQTFQNLFFVDTV